MEKIKDHSLYLIITEEYGRGRKAVDVAGAAIAGGVDIIQMREKNKSRGELLSLGKQLAALCKARGVIFIVNDDPALTKEIDADGVHLGQEDLKRVTVSEARRILGKDKIIGISASSLSEIEAANKEDIDYVAFGPVFPTAVKGACVGTKDAKKVIEVSKKAVFFIGGISLLNMGELLEKGAKNIALIRAISEADDMTAAAKEIKEKLKEA